MKFSFIYAFIQSSIHIYIYIYIYIYVAIGEKTERLYFEEYTLSLSVFSPIAKYIALYFYVSSTVKRKNQYTDFQFINIFMYKNKVT